MVTSDSEWDNDWQQMIASDNKWQRMVQQMTTNDKEWSLRLILAEMRKIKENSKGGRSP